MDDLLNLIQQANQNRSLFVQKLVALKAPQSFKMIGYDTTTGKYRLQASDRTICYTEAMTNGGVSIGQIVRLRAGSIFSGFDAMPRKRRFQKEDSTAFQDNSLFLIKTIFAVIGGENINFYLGGDRESLILQSVSSYSSLLGGRIINLGANTALIYWYYNFPVIYNFKELSTNQISTNTENYLAEYFGDFWEETLQITENGSTAILSRDKTIEAPYTRIIREIKSPDNSTTFFAEQDLTKATINGLGQLSICFLVCSHTKTIETFPTANILSITEKDEQSYQETATSIAVAGGYISEIDGITYSGQLTRPETNYDLEYNTSLISEDETYFYFETTLNVKDYKKVINIGAPIVYYYIIYRGDYLPVPYSSSNPYFNSTPMNPNGILNTGTNLNLDNSINGQTEYTPDYFPVYTGANIHPFTSTYRYRVAKNDILLYNVNDISGNNEIFTDDYGLENYKIFVDLALKQYQNSRPGAIFDQDGLGYTQNTQASDTIEYRNVINQLLATGVSNSNILTKGLVSNPYNHYLLSEDTRIETMSGTGAVMLTPGGSIEQDFEGQMRFKRGFDITTESNERVFTPKRTEWEFEEIRNIIKYKKEDTEIILNTGDFGIINTSASFSLNSGLTVSEQLFTKKTTNFQVIADNTNNKNRKIKNLSGLNFNPSSFNGEFVLSTRIQDDEGDNEYGIIEGNVSSSYTNYVFTINCVVTKISLNTPSSFPDKLILNNGSFYNYFFRKLMPVLELPFNTYADQETGETKELLDKYFLSITQTIESFGLFYNKSIFPMQPLVAALCDLGRSSINANAYLKSLFSNFIAASTSHHNTDNIVNNSIYSVVKIEDSTAWVEEWSISDSGDVKYNRAFQAAYFPLKEIAEGESLTVFAHSYYPGA